MLHIFSVFKYNYLRKFWRVFASFCIFIILGVVVLLEKWQFIILGVVGVTGEMAIQH